MAAYSSTSTPYLSLTSLKRSKREPVEQPKSNIEPILPNLYMYEGIHDNSFFYEDHYNHNVFVPLLTN
jgi:hypothetical protein